VLAKAIANLAQTTQINDPSHARLGSRFGKALCEQAVLIGVLRPHRDHRVNEVVRCRASPQMLGKRSSVRQIVPHNLDVSMPPPRPFVQLPRASS
jgi:hypothetical protein